MKSILKHSELIKQELSKEDFSTLARIVNNVHNSPNDENDSNEGIVNNAINEHLWIQDLSLVKSRVHDDYVRIVEDSIVFLATPLLISMADKIIRKTFLPDRQDIFNPVFYAGVVGLKKGIKKYDDSKDSGKSIHYIARWFNVYADRELARSEAAALGVPYTRYKTLKKISAVRIKMTESLKRHPTNEEIVNYFHSGGAELSNRGKKNTDLKTTSPPKISKSNLAVTITDVVEQERIYEAYFLNINGNVEMLPSKSN